MKRMTLFAIVALMTLMAKSAPIDRQQALNVAINFASSRGIEMKSVRQTAFHAPRKNAEDGDCLYVFNLGDDRGFVVVSGDDAIDPILGYSNQGSIDTEKMPENMRAFLNGLAEEVRLLAERGLSPSATDSKMQKIQTAKRAIKPICTTTWNQGDPYNALCPPWYNDDGTLGGVSATGCVATALAQVVAHYRYPEATKAEIPQHDYTSGTKAISLPAIPAGTPIDWNSMCDNYSSDNTQAEKDAVAELMLIIGQGVRMGYGASSGAGYSDGVKCLRDYLGFDDDVHQEYRSHYTIDDWTDLLYNELSAGNPIAYAGTATGGAHAFVVDGFDGDKMFHINWGWGGMNDGYFRIGILNPDDNSGIGASTSSDGYSMAQEAVMGLHLPDAEKTDFAASLTINDSEITTTGIKSNYINWTGESGSFDCSLSTIGDDGRLTPFGRKQTVTLDPNYYYSLEFSVAALSEGTWRIVPSSRRTGTNTWRTSFNINNDYFVVTVRPDGSRYIERHEPIEDLEVTEWNPTTSLVKGEQQTVEVTIHNNSEEEYYGELHFFASKTNQKGTQQCRSQLSVKSGQDETLAFTFTPSSAGTYNLWVCFDENGSNVLAETSLNITSTAVSQENLNVNTLTYTGSSGSMLYGTSIPGKITIANKSSENVATKIRINLWRGEIGENLYWSIDSRTLTVEAEAGASVVLPFCFDDLENNKSYALNICYTTRDGELSGGGLGHVVSLFPGITQYLNDGTTVGAKPNGSLRTNAKAVAVDLTSGATLTKVVLSGDPSCLYFFRSDDTPTADFDKAYVVTDGKISKFNIVDDWGFYAPHEFTAESVSYSRMIDANTSMQNWTTITLPFAPTRITVDGQDIDFRPSANESEGLMALKRFAYTDDDERPCFDRANELEANVPYLVAFDKSLAGKKVEFSTTDAEFQRSADLFPQLGTDAYTMCGCLLPSSVDETVYVLNDSGTAFVPASSGMTVGAYRAYLKCSLPASLRPESIAVSNMSDGIQALRDNAAAETDAVYNLAGSRIDTSKPMHRGVYIKRGRAFVVK